MAWRLKKNVGLKAGRWQKRTSRVEKIDFELSGKVWTRGNALCIYLIESIELRKDIRYDHGARRREIFVGVIRAILAYRVLCKRIHIPGSSKVKHGEVLYLVLRSLMFGDTT